MSAALSLVLFLIMVVLSPLVFGDMMLTSLAKLHLDSHVALALVVAMFLGGLINIPITKVQRTTQVRNNPLAIYGLADFWPEMARTSPETIIAVNVGGCLVPSGVALYEIAYLFANSPGALALCGAGCVANVIVCYLLARPVKGIGIAMPGLIPPFVAALLAMFLVPDAAPPVAFIIGVIGPLVGADLLHLKDIELVEAGVASIGGAGTFDGIVLSGIIAAYLS